MVQWLSHVINWQQLAGIGVSVGSGVVMKITGDWLTDARHRHETKAAHAGEDEKPRHALEEED